MSTRRNPFSPTFGRSPAVLVGRDAILSGIEAGFDDGSGSPVRTVLFTGARGMGKTVMLNEYEELARVRGWLVISEGASVGLLERLTRDHLPRLLSEASGDSPSRLTSAGVTLPVVGGGASVAWQERYPAESTLRAQITRLTDVLREHETGLVITVDEIQSADREELRKLGEVLQHARREERDLAFAGAGLNAAVDQLLNDDVVTFLRRAERYDLGCVPLDDVRDGLARTIATGGRTIGAQALEAATVATAGYPFLIQLVGYRVWAQRPDAVDISAGDVDSGVTEATQRLGTQVHQPALAALSARDREYLQAMAVDDGPSSTGEVAQRLGVSAQHAGVYRSRLVAQGIIEPAGWGRVRFTLPYLRDHLLNG